MIRKNKKLVYWFLILILIGVRQVNAFTFGPSFADTGDGGSSSTDEIEPWPMGSVTDGNTTTIYSCEYAYEITANSNVTINGYDLKDKSIMTSSIKIADEDRILSGTSLGLSVSEYKYVKWGVTKADAMEQKVTVSTSSVYKCTYSDPPDCSDPGVAVTFCSINLFSKMQFVSISCSAQTPIYVTGYSTACPAVSGCNVSKAFSYNTTSTSTSAAVKTSNAEKIEECTNHATEEATKAAQGYLYPSYQLSLPDSNEVDGTETMVIDPSGTTPTPSGASGELSTTYQYAPNKVCLDVLTAQVRYITSDDDCNNSELEVENGTDHWHYFVPLSADSKYQPSLNLMPSNKGLLNKEQCKYVIEQNPKDDETPDTATTYVDLIVDHEYKDFEGDYNKGTAGLDANNIENGCYLTSKVKIPLVQKFYNEVIDEDENRKFKGFNFYYKPITIMYDNKSSVPTNVFPNGIATNSLWYEWKENWENGTYSPDLTQSFDKVTYIATDIKFDDVRTYNSSNPYTSWKKMNVDGSSQYISSGNQITRNDNDDYYKLGCGPTNEDWSDCE